MSEPIYSITTVAADGPAAREKPPLVLRALRAGLFAAVLGFAVAWMTLPSSGHHAAWSLVAGVALFAFTVGSAVSLLASLVLNAGRADDDRRRDRGGPAVADDHRPGPAGGSLHGPVLRAAHRLRARLERVA